MRTFIIVLLICCGIGIIIGIVFTYFWLVNEPNSYEPLVTLISEIVALLLLFFTARQELKKPNRKKIIRNLITLADAMNNVLINKANKPMIDYWAELAALNFDDMPEKHLFQKMQSLLMESTKINNGIQKGYKIGQASEVVGEILNYFKITNKELEKEGGQVFIKKMDAMRKLMGMTGKWRV